MINIIKNFKTSELTNTRFIHPVKVSFNLNGKDKAWEAVSSHDSVAILLYHEERNAFLLVKQFRAPVYLNDNSKTYTYELCAGLVDKDKSLIEIAKEEIDEECGYKVSVESIQKVTSFLRSNNTPSVEDSEELMRIQEDVEKSSVSSSEEGYVSIGGDEGGFDK